MSKKNRNTEALIDIYNASKNVLDFTNEISFDNFETNKMVQSATLYQIQIIGEATKKLSLEFREENSHIPWRQIAGMRDKIVHDYNGINLETVWSAAKVAIPELLEQIQVLVPQQPESDR